MANQNPQSTEDVDNAYRVIFALTPPKRQMLLAMVRGRELATTQPKTKPAGKPAAKKAPAAATA